MRNEKLLKILSALAFILIIAIAIVTTNRKEKEKIDLIREYPLTRVTILNTEVILDNNHHDYSTTVDCKSYEENVQMINYKLKRSNSEVTVTSVFFKQDKPQPEPSKDMDRFDINIDVKTDETTANYHFFVTCEGYNE